MQIVFARHLQPGKALLVYKRLGRRASWTTFLHPVVGVLGWLTLFQATGHAGGPSVTSTTGAVHPSECSSSVCSAVLSPEDREALGRLAYAEAGDQGGEGLAAVLYAVLNRLASGRFGSDATAVIVRLRAERPSLKSPASLGRAWRALFLRLLRVIFVGSTMPPHALTSL